MNIYRRIASRFPWLGSKLSQAGMDMKPEDFIKRTVYSSFYMTTGIILIVFGFFSKIKALFPVLAISVPVIFVVMFFYMIRLPDVKTLRKGYSIDGEVMDAGRFMIVEMESGVSLYDALKSTSRNFDHIGKAFKEIIADIDTGVSMDEAMNEAIENTPSQHLRRILWQILNSVNTGSDIGRSLKEVIDQISREQIIEVRRYGRKLNPIAMFYMIIAVIIPSLGVTMLVVLSSFLSIDVDRTILIVIALMLAFLQFMFVTIVKGSRPAVSLE